MKTFLKLAVVAALCLPACAQSYTVLTPASQFITINLPSGVVWQIGNVADNKWSADQTTTSAVSFTAWYAEFKSYPYISTFLDPDPTKPEVFRIKQTAVQQTIYLTDRSVTPSKIIPTIIPALAVVAPPPPFKPTIVATYTGCIIDVSSDGTFTARPGTCTAVPK